MSLCDLVLLGPDTDSQGQVELQLQLVNGLHDEPGQTVDVGGGPVVRNQVTQQAIEQSLA